MMELWRIQSTPSLPSFPGPHLSVEVTSDKDPIYGSNRTKPRTYAKMNYFKNNCFDM